MLRLNPKVLIGAGVTGIVGIGGYGIYVAVKKDETIFEALTNKKFSFFNTDGSADDGEWDKKVKAYKSKKPEDPTLDGYVEKNVEIDKEKMKKICADLVKEPSKNVNKLKQAEKWCTKDKK